MPWMGIQDLWTFLVAVLVFLALPGPGTFTLLTATGRGGVRGGYTALAGLLVGDQILMWLALAGVAALLKANRWCSTPCSTWVRPTWCGSASACCARRSTRAVMPARSACSRAATSSRRSWSACSTRRRSCSTWRSCRCSSIRRHQGIATFAALAGIILVVSIAYCSMLIGVGNLARRRLIQHPRISDALRRVAGLFLVGFGIRLGLNG
jgi:threonine/homoserine/homoserine lactone efflux protein